MARRRFNPNQKRDSHGRWTSGGSSAGSRGSRAGVRAKAIGKALFVPKRPVNSRTGKPLSNKQVALTVAVALAPLALPALGGALSSLDSRLQFLTQQKITSNQKNYERARRAATFGISVAKRAPANFAKKRGGVYNISSMSGRKV